MPSRIQIYSRCLFAIAFIAGVSGQVLVYANAGEPAPKAEPLKPAVQKSQRSTDEIKEQMGRIRDDILRRATGLPSTDDQKPEKDKKAKKKEEVERPVKTKARVKPASSKRAPKGKKGGKEAKKAKSPPTPQEPKVIEIPGKEGGVVYWLEVHDTIELGLAPYMERALEKANKDPRTRAVISEIHTPGGRVDAAVRIRDALLRAKAPTLAFINSEAISAGALIALAHDYIVVVPGGTIGAATPIQMGAGEAKAVGEKVVSYVRGVFRATAEARDRDPRVAEAMVDADVEIPELVDKGKLLTASADEAVHWGIVDLKVNSKEDLLEQIGVDAASVQEVGENWAESLARVLTHPVVSGLLMSLGFLGLLMEFYSPGFGVTGSIGVSCLLLFFVGQYVVQLAGLEEMVVFLLGMVLLGAEIFITPGFGVLGLLGLFLLIGGLVFSLHEVPHVPVDFPFDAQAFSESVFRVFLSLSITLVLMVIMIRRLSGSSPFRSMLVLTESVSGKAVSVGGVRASEEGVDEESLNGMSGVAQTPLRPSGKVRVRETVYDAITQGEFLSAGQEIEVVGTFGSSVVVQTPTSTAAEAEDPGAVESEHGEPESGEAD